MYSILVYMKEEPRFVLERLLGLMDRRGWDASQLGMYSGVKYDTVYKYVTGQRSQPTVEVVARFAAGLGCSIEYLLNMTDNPAPPTGTDGMVYTVVDDAKDRRIVQEILTAVASMNTEDKQYIASLIRRIIPAPPRIIGDSPHDDT